MSTALESGAIGASVTTRPGVVRVTLYGVGSAEVTVTALKSVADWADEWRREVEAAAERVHALVAHSAWARLPWWRRWFQPHDAQHACEACR